MMGYNMLGLYGMHSLYGIHHGFGAMGIIGGIGMFMILLLALVVAAIVWFSKKGSLQVMDPTIKQQPIGLWEF